MILTQERLELAGVLVVAVAVLAFSVWLALSRIWGRRRIPERVGPMFEPGTIHPVSNHVTVIGLTAAGRRHLEQVQAEDAPHLFGAVRRTPLRAQRRDVGPFQFPPRVFAFPYDQERENG